MYGRGDFLDQAIRCAEKFDIRHEILDTADITKALSTVLRLNERAYFEYDERSASFDSTPYRTARDFVHRMSIFSRGPGQFAKSDPPKTLR
jgi:hypothetical protein